MPSYDYRCSICNHHFSETLRIDDRKKPIEDGCPECGEVLDGVDGFPAVSMVLGMPMTSYSTTTRRTDDDFNSKLKQLRDKVPAQYRANLEKNIR